MKSLHALLICILVLVIFSYTAATLSPLVQQNIDLTFNAKTALRSSRKSSPKEKSGPVALGDPVDDPIPQNRKN
ncbi:MAG: hypothetical protein PVF15_03945 [Candidatus Bathyarchaeota archaeon]